MARPAPRLTRHPTAALLQPPQPLGPLGRGPGASLLPRVATTAEAVAPHVGRHLLRGPNVVEPALEIKVAVKDA